MEGKVLLENVVGELSEEEISEPGLERYSENKYNDSSDSSDLSESDSDSDSDSDDEKLERVKCEYTKKEFSFIKNRNKSIYYQYNGNENFKLYKNQKNTSKEIMEHFTDRRVVFCMTIARTQSGKTGIMASLIKRYTKEKKDIIDIENNVYIITGLSSVDWVTQTKERFPKGLHENIFHQNDKDKFLERIKGKNNILIIIDEVHIATLVNQTLDKVFGKGGLGNKQNLFERDVKIVEFSATPNGSLYDMMKWNDENFRLVFMNPGKGYMSSYDLLKQNRVFEHKSFVCEEKEAIVNIRELKNQIFKYKTPRYHIVRTHSDRENTDKNEGLIKKRFDNVFGKSVNYIEQNNNNDNGDINNILREKPKKHTIIYIKEMLRCSKTIHKEFIGVLYERKSSHINDSVIIQGLIGRATGYDDNGDLVVYTCTESVEKYEKLWNTRFSPEGNTWNSGSTKNTKDGIESKGTYQRNREIMEKPIITKIFDNLDRTKKYIQEKFSDKFGPRDFDKRVLSKGFYKTSMSGIAKVRSLKEVLSNKNKIPKGNEYSCYWCYKNIKDKKTLRFVVNHY